MWQQTNIMKDRQTAWVILAKLWGRKRMITWTSKCYNASKQEGCTPRKLTDTIYMIKFKGLMILRNQMNQGRKNAILFSTSVYKTNYKAFRIENGRVILKWVIAQDEINTRPLIIDNKTGHENSCLRNESRKKRWPSKKII